MHNDDISNSGKNTQFFLAKTTPQPASIPQFQKFGDIKMAKNSKLALDSSAKLARLPANLKIALPKDVPTAESFEKIKKLGSPSDIQTALNWDRVTDAQREQDKIHYKELQNYGNNVKDGVTTLRVAVKVATEVTKLGQDLVGYAIGIEGIRTQEVNLEIAKEKTAQRKVVLQGEQQKTTHLGAVNTAKQSLYAADLDTISQMLSAKQEKSRLVAESVRNQPIIDVDSESY